MAMLFLTMSRLRLMPLELDGSAIIFERRDELRQVRLGGLAVGPFSGEKAPGPPAREPSLPLRTSCAAADPACGPSTFSTAADNASGLL